MERDPEVTPVVFRVWRDDGDIFALFPGFKWGAHGLVYHFQHGKADYRVCTGPRTRPATAAETAPLKAELESLGYKLRVLKRRPAGR